MNYVRRKCKTKVLKHRQGFIIFTGEEPRKLRHDYISVHSITSQTSSLTMS